MGPKPPRHVLITGAAGAIGSALARAMRAAWPDARLALLDQDAAAAAALAGELGDAHAVGVDLRDVDGLADVVAALARDRGPLDGLVSAAGTMRVKPLTAWGWEEARDLIAVDLLAPLRLQDLLARGLVARGAGGIIVNVTSMAGKVPLRGCAYYGAAKAGLALASEVARAELAVHGIRVVTVYPGAIATPRDPCSPAELGSGLFARFTPDGQPAELARRVVHAVDHGQARVIYPALYGIGWSAPNLARWFSLSFGPPAR